MPQFSRVLQNHTPYRVTAQCHHRLARYSSCIPTGMAIQCVNDDVSPKACRKLQGASHKAYSRQAVDHRPISSWGHGRFPFGPSSNHQTVNTSALCANQRLLLSVRPNQPTTHRPLLAIQLFRNLACRRHIRRLSRQ